MACASASVSSSWSALRAAASAFGTTSRGESGPVNNNCICASANAECAGQSPARWQPPFRVIGTALRKPSGV